MRSVDKLIIQTNGGHHFYVFYSLPNGVGYTVDDDIEPEYKPIQSLTSIHRFWETILEWNHISDYSKELIRCFVEQYASPLLLATQDFE